MDPLAGVLEPGETPHACIGCSCYCPGRCGSGCGWDCECPSYYQPEEVPSGAHD